MQTILWAHNLGKYCLRQKLIFHQVSLISSSPSFVTQTCPTWAGKRPQDQQLQLDPSLVLDRWVLNLVERSLTQHKVYVHHACSIHTHTDPIHAHTHDFLTAVRVHAPTQRKDKLLHWITPRVLLSRRPFPPWPGFHQPSGFHLQVSQTAFIQLQPEGFASTRKLLPPSLQKTPFQRASQANMNQIHHRGLKDIFEKKLFWGACSMNRPLKTTFFQRLFLDSGHKCLQVRCRGPVSVQVLNSWFFN